MSFTLETASPWEYNRQYQIPNPYVIPEVVNKVVREHFTTTRTEDWKTRLANYWDFQDKRKADEKKYGTYKWVQFGRFYHTYSERNVNLGQGPGETFSGMLSRLLDAHPNSLHDAGAGLVAYKLRSTVAMHKRLRVGTEFHGFLQLPSEIRNLIYGYLLLKGTVLVPTDYEGSELGHPCWRAYDGQTYDRYHGLERAIKALQIPRGGSRKRNPLLGLIQGVSRAVHAEATGVYFGGNRFVVPTGPIRLPSFFVSLVGIASDDVQEMDRQFRRRFERGENNAPLVRDVSYAFHMRDHVTSDYANLCFNDSLRADIDEVRISPQEALRRLHDQRTFELEIVWAERVDCIKWMTLDRLQLSFDECYCSIGCCRKVEWVLDRFLNTGPPPGTVDNDENVYSMVDWKARPPLVIECTGWKNSGEARLIREKLGNLGESLGSIEIHFGLSIDVTEPMLDDGDRFLLDMLEGETSGG
ncbi:hypothetical protein VMCG_08108 [Cytospora schulzeri]|uniref:F-box domain-containing protein n=1 Tax=Cytospora schulzeri TaxID=448051 RepID=A0A423VRF9_9PEZI|nr:hypothetical protein VMCG_08108 [Valsa malicola]